MLIRNLVCVLLIKVLTGTQPTAAQDYWKGSSLPGKSFADFANFTGKQAFKISVPKTTGQVKFHYEVRQTQGSLKFIIKSSSHEVLSKQISGTENGNITIRKDENETLKFYLVGDKAEGSYLVTYSY